MAYAALPAKIATDTITLANYDVIKDDFAAGVPDLFTSKGDLAVGTAADTAVRLGVGNDDDTLVPDSTQAAGLAWQIQPAVRAYHNATQTPTVATWTTLAFNSERFDTNGMHDLVTNNSRLTVPAGGAGLYMVGACVQFVAGTAGALGLRLLLNGTTVITEFENISAGAAAIAACTLYALAVGDYLEAQVYDSVAATVPAGANYSPEFWAIWQRRA